MAQSRPLLCLRVVVTHSTHVLWMTHIPGEDHFTAYHASKDNAQCNSDELLSSQLLYFPVLDHS